MSDKTVEESVQSFVDQIEADKRAIAAEINVPEDSAAARAGAEAIAKATAEDLDWKADVLENAGTYISMQDKLRAIAAAIRKRYGIRAF